MHFTDQASRELQISYCYNRKIVFVPGSESNNGVIYLHACVILQNGLQNIRKQGFVILVLYNVARGDDAELLRVNRGEQLGLSGGVDDIAVGICGEGRKNVVFKQNFDRKGIPIIDALIQAGPLVKVGVLLAYAAEGNGRNNDCPETVDVVVSV